MIKKSELEILMATSDYNIRKYILGLIDYKKQISNELQLDDLSVEREIQLKESLEIINENIGRIRSEGIL